MLNRESLAVPGAPMASGSMAASFDGFEAMQQHFAIARELHGQSEHYFQVAGLLVCLRVVGNELSKHLLAPFFHLCQRKPLDENVALTINVWDESETTVDSPIHGSVHNIGRTVTASADGRFVAEQDSFSLVLLDRRSNCIVAAYSTHDRLACIDRARPFNRLLSLWYREHGVQVIHAGLVAKADKGVLFVGNKGAGKSTCSIACVEAGFDYLGDDLVGLNELDDGSFVGHSLYGSALLAPNHFRRFHSLQAAAGEDPGLFKRISFISNIFAEKMRRCCSISAIVIPHVVGAEESCISRATRTDAIKSLAPSSLRLHISPSSDQFQQLTRLVEQVPCYKLQIGESISDIASCIESLAL
jgi:hypothetical protein